MQDQTILPDGAPLGVMIALTRRRIKQALWPHLALHGLTPQQFWMLQVLQEKGSLSLHDLATQVWIDDPTACRIVKGLADKGLLKSEPDPDHGRRVRIRLGEGGKKLMPTLQELSRQFRTALASRLTPEEQAELRRLLAQVMQGVDSVPAPEEPVSGRRPRTR